MLWAGNWFPDYIDKGQVSRRVLTANFEKNVTEPDVTLKSRIINEELPAFIYKTLLYYKKFVDLKITKDIWSICPESFLEQKEELKLERNPLYKFLTENTGYKDGATILIEEVRKNFSNWLGKGVSKLDNGTFGQVNKLYIIETKMTCKNCNNEAKKGCCEKYNNSQRTRKTIIRNLELIKKC